MLYMHKQRMQIFTLVASGLFNASLFLASDRPPCCHSWKKILESSSASPSPQFSDSAVNWCVLSQTSG